MNDNIKSNNPFENLEKDNQLEPFEKILNEKNFVDKTHGIEILINNKNYVNVFPRKSGYGKTTFLSMLDYYFNIERDKDFVKNIFKNLKIGINNINIANYPVISLNWCGCTNSSFFEHFKNNIKEIYENKIYLKTKLTENNINYFDKVINKQLSTYEYIDAVYRLVEFLHNFYNKNVIILIDEFNHYLTRLNNDYNCDINYISKILNKLYNCEYVEKIIITGTCDDKLNEDENKLFNNMFNVKINYAKDNKVLKKHIRFSKYDTLIIGYECIGFNELESEEILKKNNLGINDKYVREFCSIGEINKNLVCSPKDILYYINSNKEKQKELIMEANSINKYKKVINNSNSSAQIAKELDKLLNKNEEKNK